MYRPQTTIVKHHERTPSVLDDDIPRGLDYMINEALEQTGVWNSNPVKAQTLRYCKRQNYNRFKATSRLAHPGPVLIGDESFLKLMDGTHKPAESQAFEPTVELAMLSTVARIPDPAAVAVHAARNGHAAHLRHQATLRISMINPLFLPK